MDEALETTSLVEPAADLEGLTQRINEICRSVTLDLAFKVGELVVKELFSRRTELWERDGRRAPSYRALAARGDLMLSASALCRAVGVYVLVERLGGRERWTHLGASHFQEVLSLGAESRKALLQEAEEKQWPVARLRAEAQRRRRARSSPSVALELKPLRRISSNLAVRMGRLAQTDLSELPDDQVQAVREIVKGMRDTLTQVEAMLDSSRGQPARRDSDIVELRGGPECPLAVPK
ncbi:MAG TPA: hypothetical protein VGJ91_02165 [Polyangiaceae bacterium]|jgi:hypothetical protein